jgi:transcriptional regulator with XRE-family HTH domain
MVTCWSMDETVLYKDFGRLVRDHRRRVRVTQSQLGERIGLSRTSITNIEQGRQKVLLHQIFALAESLEIRPEALLPAVTPSEMSPRIEEKLDKHLKGTEKDWARRIVASGSKGGRPHATSKS